MAITRLNTTAVSTARTRAGRSARPRRLPVFIGDQVLADLEPGVEYARAAHRALESRSRSGRSRHRLIVSNHEARFLTQQFKQDPAQPARRARRAGRVGRATA